MHKFNLAELEAKVTIDQLRYEYLELNLDRKTLTEKYDLRPCEWLYLLNHAGLKKPKALSHKKCIERGLKTKLENPSHESCRLFIENHKDEIQKLMNSGKSLLDIFNYYQELVDPIWNDYTTFGVYVRKAGLKFSDEAKELIKETRASRFSNTMINKSPEAKKATYNKYRKSLDNIPEDIKSRYIAQKEATKRAYTDEQKYQRVFRMVQSKKKNNSFSTSGPEERLYNILCNEFDPGDIDRQHIDDKYPYACDFYIRSINLYIELNGFYVHGDHPFNPKSNEDLQELEYLKMQPATRTLKTGRIGKSYAAMKIYVWAIKDREKLDIALTNKLQYIAIYPEITCKYNIENNYKFLERVKEIW